MNIVIESLSELKTKVNQPMQIKTIENQEILSNVSSDSSNSFTTSKVSSNPNRFLEEAK